MVTTRNRARRLSLAIALAIAAPSIARGAEAPLADAGVASETTPVGMAVAAAPDGAITEAPASVPLAVDTTPAAPAAALTAAPAPAPAPDTPVLRQWWFWGAIGVVAAVGVVAAIVLTRPPGRPGCPAGFACE